MPTTPRLGIFYPNFRKDPWFDEIESTLREFDAAIYTSREDRNLVLMEGGTVSWNATTGQLIWSADILLNATITGLLWTISAGSAIVQNGELLYVNLTRHPVANTTTPVFVASQVPLTDAGLMLAIRKGTLLYWRDGRVIDTGFSGSLFTLPSGAEDLATTLAAGNLTGGTDIVLSSGDKITAPEGKDIRLWTLDGSADAGGISIIGGDGLAGEGGGITIRGGEGSSGNIGGDVQITGGTGGDGVYGGGAIVKGGEGGTSSSVGGNALIQGGRGGSPNGDGGDVRLVPGAAVGSGSAGVVKAEGNMEVTGKLTVAGLIDPTGIVFDEGSAPSTGVDQGALFVDPADNHLKFRAESDGTVTDLLSGGGETLAQTLALGNATGGYDILVSSGDRVTAPQGNPLSLAGGLAALLAAGEDISAIASNASPGSNGAGGDVNLTAGSGDGSGADGRVRVSTAMILKEAETSTPITGTTEGALFVDPADNHLKFREESNGTVTDLLAGGGAATSTAMARVDPNSSDAIDNNDLTTAFVTIQGGVDAIANAGGGTVYVYPGLYDETVYIKDSNFLAIVGLSGPTQELSDRCVIRPTAAKPGIIVTQATKASMDAMLAASASWSQYAANWGTLVADTAWPASVELANLSVDGGTGHVSLLVAGVSANSTLLSEGLELNSCYLEYGCYARTAVIIRMDDIKSDYINNIYNVGELQMMDGWVYSCRQEYSASFAQPSGGMKGFSAAFLTFRGNLAFYGSQSAGPHPGNTGGFFNNVHILGFLQIIGPSSVIYIQDSYAEGNCSVPSGCQLHARQFVVGGYLYFNSGSGACSVKGGGGLADSLLNPDPSSRVTDFVRVSDEWFKYKAVKANPVTSDWLLLHDSADSDKLKAVTLGNMPGGGFEYDSGANEVQSLSGIVTAAADFVFGSTSLDDIGTDGDSRMLFDKSKYAFRAGYVQGTEWDDANRAFGSACFGFNCTTGVLGIYGVAHGQRVVADQQGMYAHSGDLLSGVAPGGSQYCRLTVMQTTTDATPTELWMNDLSSSNVAININHTWALKILIVARQTGGTAGTVGDSAGYEISAVVKNIGGTVSYVGTPTVTPIAEDDAAWTVALGTAAPANITILATGAVDKTIHWFGTLFISRIS